MPHRHIYTSSMLLAQTIGLDVDKDAIVFAKKSSKHIYFICADLCHLPIRNDSVDIAVCASVLEYIQNLEDAIRQIRFTLKKGGTLGAGYPIETTLLKAIIEFFHRKAVREWNPHRVMGDEEYRKDPHTHKQIFPTIRAMLGKYFLLMRREKTASIYFPDFLSIYECVKLLKP